MFGFVDSQLGRVFVLFHSQPQNMDSLQDTGDQLAVETVGYYGQVDTKEGKVRYVSHQSHGGSFLVCTRYNPHR